MERVKTGGGSAGTTSEVLGVREQVTPPPTVDSLGENGKRLIHMNVHMPTWLAESHLPLQQGFYKPNQELVCAIS